MLANPDIITHNGITLQRQFVFHWSNGTAPITANDVKRIGRHAIHPMVGSIHDKLHSLRDCAELANDQSVTDEIIEMSDMLLELVSTIYIIVVGVITYDNTRVLHHVFNEAEAWNLRIRKSLIGIGSGFYFHKFLFIFYISLQK